MLVSFTLAIVLIYFLTDQISSPVKEDPTDQDRVFTFRALLDKGGNFQENDQTDSALYYYHKALDIASSLKNQSYIAKSKNGIANCYLRSEDYPKAMVYLVDALKSAELSGDKHCQGLIYNGLGLVNISIGKTDIAIAHFEKAKNLCKESGDLQNAAGISLNIANCYVEKDNFLKARDFYEDHLNTITGLNDTSQIILALVNVSTVNRFLNEYRLSFQYIDQALNLLEIYPSNSLKCTALIQKGLIYFNTGDYSNAKKLFLESLEVSSGTLSRSNSMEALLHLSEIAEKEGNYSDALDLFRNYTLLKDSVMNDETRNTISEIQLKADVQKKEYENEILTAKIEVQKRRGKTVGVVLGLFIIIILLIITLIWLSLKNLRKSYILKELENSNLAEKIRSDELQNKIEKLRFESEIESKNKELTSVSLQLINKNKILSDISNMSSRQYSSGSMDGITFKELQRIVTDNLNIDKDWEKFKSLFEKVHSGFFIKLKEEFPDLSENELRLCAYLRINLQNKEIARILNVNPSTVVTSRYRIRKKMRLENKIVLEDHLRNF
ncbi:MAG TPA: tetratricopeptide repeat protein [Lentimicrobium sp.]|nr:tetratricopeptide repeat protein [Lentimicrobium sp.]